MDRMVALAQLRCPAKTKAYALSKIHPTSNSHNLSDMLHMLPLASSLRRPDLPFSAIQVFIRWMTIRWRSMRVKEVNHRKQAWLFEKLIHRKLAEQTSY